MRPSGGPRPACSLETVGLSDVSDGLLSRHERPCLPGSLAEEMLGHRMPDPFFSPAGQTGSMFQSLFLAVCYVQNHDCRPFHGTWVDDGLASSRGPQRHALVFPGVNPELPRAE